MNENGYQDILKEIIHRKWRWTFHITGRKITDGRLIVKQRIADTLNDQMEDKDIKRKVLLGRHDKKIAQSSKKLEKVFIH